MWYAVRVVSVLWAPYRGTYQAIQAADRDLYLTVPCNKLYLRTGASMYER